MRLTATIAAAVLLAGSAVASAHADTYAWTAGQDNGTFTTGAASPVGAGYYLLTDFFFATADAGDRIYTNEDIKYLNNNASFNPTMDTLANNAGGGFYQDTSYFLNKDIALNSGVAVGYRMTITDQNSSFAQGFSSAVFTVVADLSAPPTPAAPEPSTWALMFAGIGLAGFALRSRKSVTVAA